MEGRVEGYETAMGDEGREMGREGGSEELDIGAGFIDEVEEGGGREDGRDRGAAGEDGGAEDGHAAVLV